MKYSVSRGEKEIGSFDFAELQALFHAGVLHPSDHFCINGMEEWKLLSELLPVSTAGTPGAGEVRVRQFSKQLASSTSFDDVRCPRCSSDSVAKASAIFERELRITQIEGYSARGTHYDRRSESYTPRAHKCAPPDRPEYPIRGVLERMITLVAVSAATIFGITAMVVVSSVGFLPATPFICLCLASFATSFHFRNGWIKAKLLNEQEHQQQMSEYQGRLAAYSRTWNCDKCGALFVSNNT